MNTLYVLVGLTLLGAVSGLLGVFAYLKRKSLLSDTLAHAALPGVCLAFLLTGSKHLGWLLTGAAISGWAGVLAVSGITRYSKLKEDSAMGLTLSIFFGFGILLLTVIQKSAGGAQSGLDKFIFGSAASILPGDVMILSVVCCLLTLLALLLFKEFAMVTFDSLYAKSIGLPAGRLDLLLMGMIALIVIAGLQAVGVVLMVAMLITPAATARLYTDRLAVMVGLSVLFGAASGAAGTFLSAQYEKMPTGPVMALCASGFFVLSLLFAPRHGLLRRVQKR